MMQPILQSSCALATSRAEARFRIDAPIAGRRGARVVALDDGAATLVRRLARAPWNGARFFTLVAGGPDPGGPDMPLHTTTGRSTRLDVELAEADVAVMVATTGSSGTAASIIGRACAHRGIMTAGVVLGEHSLVADTVNALRPHAQVLLVSRDEEDVAEVLSAIRA
ncbi:hypothetical protein [Pseudonocardia spinosispora]|uniref:hypothetical protein n=1 Tax=Pseudonocardia spinosispora TaxID=103441 RepID=UPI0004192CE4|nr:hypothetical protein [Pseudonocardia spinosispora]